MRGHIAVPLQAAQLRDKLTIGGRLFKMANQPTECCLFDVGLLESEMEPTVKLLTNQC
jgi:hypothetical protein